NIFIAGAGNVGGKLIQQIRQQFSYLKEQLKLQIQVVGIVNSKKILLNDTGIDLQEWKSLLQNANPGNVQDFVEAIINKNL
ncbi:hypothetical protein ABTE98_19915, partial [Acinetobacter baumannii]